MGPSQPEGEGCPPKGVLGPDSSLQLSIPQRGCRQPSQQLGSKEGGVSMFIMVVSWLRHCVKSLQMASKDLVSVFKMLAVLWLRAGVMDAGMEGCTWCPRHIPAPPQPWYP